jgi:SpoVK/Ycf46/Vps4 family AAA+-type ATPase
VLAATNLPETLDPALKRPGRFDRQVAVPLPDIRGRQEILAHYLKDKPAAADVDVGIIARQTAGARRRPPVGGLPLPLLPPPAALPLLPVAGAPSSCSYLGGSNSRAPLPC